MSNACEENGKQINRSYNANGTTTSTASDEETEKPKEQNKILQGQIRGHLNIDTEPREEKVCRKLKDQTGTSSRSNTLQSNRFLKFSAQNGHTEPKASDHNHQMTSKQINPISHILLGQNQHSTVNTTDLISSNSKEHRNESNLTHDKVVAYPGNQGYQINTESESTWQNPKYGEKKSTYDRHTKLPMKESRLFLNKANISDTPDQWSFTSTVSGKLSEENLECDSLKYDPENLQVLSSFSLKTEESNPTSYGSSELLSRSLNLIDLASGAEHLLPVGPHHIEESKRLLPKSPTHNLAHEMLKSLQVVSAGTKCELNTDGPDPPQKMTEYITKHVIPLLQQQEEESQKVQRDLAILREENYTYKENNKHLTEMVKQLEQQRNGHTQSDSLSSQTHVVGPEYIKQQSEQYSIQVSELQQETNPKTNMSHKIQQLEDVNQKLADANHRWEAQWDLLQRSQCAEIERLNQVIRNFKEQDSKRQEEFDKILLTAKRRQNDEEVAKEDALANLAQMTGHYEELQAQYEELKTALDERAKEMSRLETELATIKADNLKISEKATKTGNKKMDKKLVQQYQTEIEILKQQLTVFQEDFDRERSDRARAQSDKDDMIKQLDLMKKENERLTEQLRIAENNIQTKINQISALQKEMIELRNQLRRGTNIQQQYQHGTQNPALMQTAGYHNPQTNQSRPQTQHQYPTPKAQPVTDPYAQPLPPYMFPAHYNGQATVQQHSSPRPAQNRPQFAPELFGAWNCAFCTYVNHPQRTICEICGTHKEQGQVLNGHSGQGSQTIPRGESRQQYNPNDICVDSGDWLASN